MTDYLREQFTAPHPWTHPDDCICDFDAGRKCGECMTNAERERFQLEERERLIDRAIAWMQWNGMKNAGDQLANYLRKL